MSIVYYKFKSVKDFNKVTFDGFAISAFDLKKNIMQQKKLGFPSLKLISFIGTGIDFDLHVFNAQTNVEYKDDSDLIQKNSQVLVARYIFFNIFYHRRKPANGKFGVASRYIQSQLHVQGRIAPPQKAFSALPTHTTLINGKPAAQNTLAKGTEVGTDQDDEMEKFRRMNDEQWNVQQGIMASQRPVYRPYTQPRPSTTATSSTTKGNFGSLPSTTGAGGAEPEPYARYGSTMEQRPPPQGYICYRCGSKEHFLNNCPTHGDEKFDGPRLKRTTGIPKMFLKVVEDKGDGTNVMVTLDGKMVTVQANEAAWDQISGRQKAYKIDNSKLPPSLKCFICHDILKKASRIYCCPTDFCEECIKQTLIEASQCPKCFKMPIKLNQVIPNTEKRTEVDAYLSSLKQTTSSAVVAEAVVGSTRLASSSPAPVVNERNASPVPTLAANSGSYMPTNQMFYNPMMMMRPQTQGWVPPVSGSSSYEKSSSGSSKRHRERESSRDHSRESSRDRHDEKRRR